MKIKLFCLALALCLCQAACSMQVTDPTAEGTTLPTTAATTQATTQATTEATEAVSYSVLENAEGIQNIILIIGDGMGTQHINAGQLYDGKEYAFTQWPTVRVNTQALEANGELSTAYPDSVAASTAMATGVNTANEFVGRSLDGSDLQTILDVAAAMGKATGVVTNDYLFNGTPAGFTAHANSRNDRMVILETQLASGVNLLCGALHESCSAMADEIRAKGYAYCEDYHALEGTFTSSKAYWQLPLGGNEAALSLPAAAEAALQYLDQQEGGFVLVIEEAHIDKYCHNQAFLDMCARVSSLDQTVETVMAWLGDRTDTVVLVTADHETGSLQLSDQADKYPSTATLGGSTVSYEFRTPNHTISNVSLFVYGVDADFTRSDLYKKKALKNTGIYYLMEEILTTGEENK